ncbi:MAG: hypothetical protein JJ901_13270 [Erythrobacter sp.]|uniref:hypothetical protein n=1 Tax=Erythrobacter sp. TaxID=1042 RepID=UPI001B145A88|nr:hypothetical protein [Erythrobacter sp.]MBO6769255.1 hypothetical protein [Erythrobacter sp.]
MVIDAIIWLGLFAAVVGCLAAPLFAWQGHARNWLVAWAGVFCTLLLVGGFQSPGRNALAYMLTAVIVLIALLPISALLAWLGFHFRQRKDQMRAATEEF